MNHEHRSSARIPLQLVAHIRWKDASGRYGEAEGKTVNISGNGLFLTVPARLEPEMPFAFKVLLPCAITRTPVELVGEGRVVRRSVVGETEGVAAVIDDYRLQPLQASA
ncbi:MAG TPA: PilZ domain-containing protein [Terriglobia bacterium]|nr:PilZ domain-containing protein [Terriglobia bacterium]